LYKFDATRDATLYQFDISALRCADPETEVGPNCKVDPVIAE
jgi:hypothetical protein